MMDFPFCAGLEIYNAGYVEPGDWSPWAMDEWDWLLTQGRRFFGFITDDAHTISDIGKAWLMVQAESRSKTDIAKAILIGSFYNSTGLVIDSISCADGRVSIHSQGAALIRAIGPGGRILKESSANEMSVAYPGQDPSYVRFACQGSSGHAWTEALYPALPDE